MIISTLGGKIIDLNDQATKFLGLEKNQLINNYHDQMFENFYGKHLVSQYSLELSSNGQAQFEISEKSKPLHQVV
ncbi:hypothetical protein UACE39S_05591 [Ureibacillus acetophenoni]